MVFKQYRLLIMYWFLNSNLKINSILNRLDFAPQKGMNRSLNPLLLPENMTRHSNIHTVLFLSYIIPHMVPSVQSF